MSKIYNCRYCSKIFTYRQSRWRHERIYHYNCEKCKTKFTRKHSLKRHIVEGRSKAEKATPQVDIKEEIQEVNTNHTLHCCCRQEVTELLSIIRKIKANVEKELTRIIMKLFNETQDIEEVIINLQELRDIFIP